jgi:hypothetical protein
MFFKLKFLLLASLVVRGGGSRLLGYRADLGEFLLETDVLLTESGVLLSKTLKVLAKGEGFGFNWLLRRVKVIAVI